MLAFSKRLRDLRKEAGMTQVDLGEALHTSGAVVSLYENGREPSYDTLVSIAQIFNVSTDYLLNQTAVKQVNPSVLTATIDQHAAAAEEAGTSPVSVEDLQQLLQQMTAYLHSARSAGTQPVETTRQLLTGMTALLAALTSGSTAAVLDAGNALLTAIYSVSSITAAHLNGQINKGGTP